MIAGAALLGLLLGCGAKSVSELDLGLEDQVEVLPEQSPLAILEEGAQNLDPSTRAPALGWLVRISPETWTGPALYDPSAWVQRAAVKGLGDQLADPGNRERLEQYVRFDGADPYVRAEAGIVLVSDANPDVANALREAWRRETEPWIIAPLALASSAYGDTEAVQAVASAVESGELALETSFIRLLGASGHADLLPALKAGSEAVEDELQLPLAVARVELGDPSAEQILRKALQHNDPENRLEAVELLIHLEHPTSTALLQRARNDRVQLIQWIARMAMAARTGTDMDVFSKAWDQSDREIRLHTVRLIVAAWSHPIGGSNRRFTRQAGDLILEALKDEDPTVRLEAVRAASRMNLRDSSPLVLAQTSYPWDQLRIESAGAAWALGALTQSP